MMRAVMRTDNNKKSKLKPCKAGGPQDPKDYFAALQNNSVWLRLSSQDVAAQHGAILRSIVESYVCFDEGSTTRKRDAARVKNRFDSLIRRLETLAGEAEGLGAMSVETWSPGLPLALCLGTAPQTGFLQRCAVSLRAHAATLKELKRTFTQEWSLRQSTRAWYLLMLHAYCCAATERRVTYSEIADFLNAGLIANRKPSVITEEVIRMQLQRLNRSTTAARANRIKAVIDQFWHYRRCPPNANTP
jgi:hypothetical protein